jgi:hypothetical protein
VQLEVMKGNVKDLKMALEDKEEVSNINTHHTIICHVHRVSYHRAKHLEIRNRLLCQGQKCIEVPSCEFSLSIKKHISMQAAGWTFGSCFTVVVVDLLFISAGCRNKI